MCGFGEIDTYDVSSHFSRHLQAVLNFLPIQSMGLVYLPASATKINQMWGNIPVPWILWVTKEFWEGCFPLTSLATSRSCQPPFGRQWDCLCRRRGGVPVICWVWSKYMAGSLSPNGRLIKGLYKPIHGNCAIYFYPGSWGRDDSETIRSEAGRRQENGSDNE